MPPTTVEAVLVADEETGRAADTLIREYLTWVACVARREYGLDFDIEAMSRSDVHDKTKFFPPRGRLYVLRQRGDYIGVGALKPLSPLTCELQRMYVQPGARGTGAGRLLLDQLLLDARSIGYTSVRLESLKALAAAHALYHSVGFQQVEPYADNSMKDFQASSALDRYRQCAVFMELNL